MQLKNLWFIACLLILSACQPQVGPEAINFIATSVAQTVAAQSATPTLSVETQVALTVAAKLPNPPAQPTQPPPPPPPTATDTQMDIPTPEITATPSQESGESEPKIEFTFVPPLGSAEYLSGTVKGVNPDKYVVAIYIRVSGGWWTKPYFDSPKVDISTNSTWSTPYVTGGNDANADTIRAYLIPKTANPPMMQGGPKLPPKLEDIAVDYVEATRK